MVELTKNVQGVGASITGQRHERAGIVCEDAFGLKRYSWGFVAVIADGLGSRQKACKGAQAAIRAGLLLGQLWRRTGRKSCDDSLRHLFYALWRTEIYPDAPQDCATTGHVFVCDGYAKSGLYVGVGDGAVLLKLHDQTENLVKETKAYSNVTSCLHMEACIANIAVRALDTNNGHLKLLMCTDGIADDLLLYKYDTFFETAYQRYMHLPHRSAQALLRRDLRSWPVVSHGDDRTMVVVSTMT